MVKPIKKIPVKKEEGEQAGGGGGGSSGGKTPVKKEEGKQAGGGGDGGSRSGGDTSGKKVGTFEVENDGSLRIPQNYQFTVDKKYIDEMFSLVKVGKDGKKEIDKVPKRLRDKEKGYQYNELKKMRALHYESMLLQASKGRIDLHYGKEGAPRFRTGQSVHHFWSSWFAKAVEPKVQLQGSSRPKWYSAGIIAALGEKTIRYAGHVFSEHAYQVH